jgi:hypothetical protein
MSLRKLLSTTHPKEDARFVADGYERTVEAIASKIRQELRERDRETPPPRGLVGRWWRHWEREREIARLVKERVRHISSQALF